MKKYFVAIRKDTACMWVLPDVLAQENDGYRAIECRSVDTVSGPFVVLSEILIVTFIRLRIPGGDDAIHIH